MQRQLDPGDMLVLYSDGVTEANESRPTTNSTKSASSKC